MSSDPQFPEPPDRPRPGGRRWIDAVSERLGPWVDWFGLGRLIATAVTVVAVVAGGWWLLRTPAPPIEAGLPLAGSTSIAAATTTDAPAASAGAAPTTATSLPTVIVVHVAGAVVSPGVYELPGGARVDVALGAAGGPLAGADPGALNLAAPLADGTRVYVPMVGEEVPPSPPVAAAPGPTTPSGPIDLNHATAAELDELPGIGPATAQAIVDHRTTNGPFASVDDLEAVRGIGPAKLDAIRALVTV
ncbi:MAG: helix-hairpin-helix domain-containing protein [Ilumatobacteraceae bacterium]